MEENAISRISELSQELKNTILSRMTHQEVHAIDNALRGYYDDGEENTTIHSFIKILGSLIEMEIK